MRICIVTPLFAVSGVPLAQIRFARAWASCGHQVDLVIGKIDPVYKIPDISGVNLINFGCARVLLMLLPFSRYLYRFRPDIVFSAEDHLNTVVLLSSILVNSNSMISCSSRVSPFDTYSSLPFSKKWILKKLSRALWWRANALTCVSKDMIAQYRQVFKDPPHICIYNIVDDGRARRLMTEHVNHEWLINKELPVLIAAGSLSPWKGFSDLIQAVSMVLRNRLVRLIILGDGPLRSELENLVVELKLTNNVQFLGYVENPLKYFRSSDVFVLSSHVEGLPNVMVEAMMCGCTVVATDCPTGPREVLQDGRYGYLVPTHNPSEMALGIERALSCPIPKELLSDAVRSFEANTVMNAHLKVLGICATSEG